LWATSHPKSLTLRFALFFPSLDGQDEPTLSRHSVYAWPEGLSEALYNGTLHPSVDALFKYHAR
jgi:hypothetical protein